MHWCLNVVCGEKDEGGAVLLRAGEPLRAKRRCARAAASPTVCAPATSPAAPASWRRRWELTARFDGVCLDGKDLWLAAGEPLPRERIATGPRIGVAYAGEAAAWPLRFAMRGNLNVSRPRLP